MNGYELAQLGMTRAANAQNNVEEKWTDQALNVIISIALKNPTVHVDDVELEKDIQNLPEPSHPNAWGSVWSTAIRRNIIARSGDIRPAGINYDSPQKHRRSYPVYNSLIYQG